MAVAHAGEALFRSERGRTALDKFCAVTHLTVRVYAADHGALSEPIHRTQLFEVFARGGSAPAAFIDRLRPSSEGNGIAVLVEESGVATVGTTFRVEGAVVCRAVVGPALVAHMTERDAQQIARASGLPFDAIWMVARKELPIPRQRLVQYGELLQVVGETVLSDSYRSRRLEEALARLETSDRAKDVFLATLSHELRTPLTAIAGWMRILRTGSPDATAVAHGLDVIDRNTKLQARLIEDLLDVSRAIAGKVDLDLRSVELGSVIEAALDAARPAADAKRIRLEATLETSIGLVAGDRDRLGQIVSNLLTNAVKFTPIDGQIDVGLRRVGAEIEIRVRDSGVGIGAELLPHLFERFRQAGESPRSHGGLGLGLALVKHLAELHGGTVRAESAGAERGSTFIVRLPLTDAAQGGWGSAAPSPPDRVNRQDGLKGIRILLVEDHADSRELMTMALQDRGAAVTSVASAAEALEAFKLQRPDAIVSDIGLEAEDGYELMRQIRGRESGGGAPTPAVAVTAFSGAEDRERALAAGYQRHLIKPIDATALTRAVAELVGRR
jgi:signal transduction histidine kinase/ActR/RegA family two-component response regulator